MEDQALIGLLQSAPERGVHEAICKYENLLTAIVSRILNHEQDVEECVSDTFVELWKHCDRLDPEKGSLKGYLICTARSRAINRYWQGKRSRTVSGEEQLVLIPSEDDLENQVFLQEDTDTMLELLGEMDEPEREILLRKHFLFETVKAIAARLGLTPNQVKYRLQHGKCLLRNQLEKRGVAL